MPLSESELEAAASRLCLACGMCCNGVMFQIVRLQPEDSVEALEKLGMKLSRKKKEPYFNQPCRFLQDCACQIYTNRPSRCRQFECRQITALAGGDTTEPEVTCIIESLRLQVRKVEKLLELSGCVSVHLPLMERCREILSEAAPCETTADLDREARHLNSLLNGHLRYQPVSIPDGWGLR